MKYNKLIYLFASACFMLTLGGCLKDKDYDNGSIQSLRSLGLEKVVSIGLTATSTDNHLVLAFDNVDKDTIVRLVPVQVTGVDGATEDVQVTLTLNPALIGNYNELNGTAHDVAPSELYTIQNQGDDAGGYIVTIPKGSNTGFLTVKINPRAFLGFDYALGFQITKVPSTYLISSNLNSGVVGIGIKNEWDGVYDYKGYSLRAGDATLTGNFSGKEMDLVTKGATAVGFGSYALWGDGNAGIAISFPVLTIDNSGAAPYPVTISGDASNNPGYNSVYDPETKTFYISFTWGAGPSSRLSTDTLTYKGPR